MTWLLALLLVLPLPSAAAEARGLWHESLLHTEHEHVWHNEQQIWDAGRVGNHGELSPEQDRGPASHSPAIETWRYLAEMLYPPDPDYALRVLDCESDGNPDALGWAANEIGLWQINPQVWAPLWQTGGIFAGLDPWEPHVNTELAAYILERQGWRAWTCARLIGIP